MQSLFLNLTLISFFAASLAHFLFLIYRKHLVSVLARVSVILGGVSQIVFMGLRSSVTGHGPYTTTFEVVFFCSWLIVLVYLFVDWRYKVKTLGAFVVPLVFLILLYSMFLSRESMEVAKSDLRLWLTLHRSLSIVGYAAFTMAFVVGIMYLIQENQLKTKKLGMLYFRLPSLEVLDHINHQVVAVGFPLFTLGFMTASLNNIQMNQPFFSWDVARIWPLLACWIIYGAIFFGRLLVGWQGKKAAQGSVVGFVSIIIAYFLHI